MAANTAVHSRAFNFLSYIHSGVDPRTGQYTARLALPEIKANDLSGPAFPLSLNFNPLNLGNTGIARGWQLPLTEFDADKQIIALASGETFKVTGTSSIGNRLEMAEQKIQSFYLYRDEPTLYRVVHASGIIEMLRLEGKLALPETIYSAEGFKVSFAYSTIGDGLRRLHTVTDGFGVRLLEVNRLANAQAIEILLRPDGTPGGALVRFELKLRNSGPGEEVYEVVLPTDDLDRWQFTYRTVNGLLCITDVRTPVGAHETIEYSGTGHAFPGFAKPPLPRVWKHIIDPGFKQPLIEVHYDYETLDLPGSNNFLGNNSKTIVWSDDGLDNLYQDNSRYQYGTTERHFAGGVEVRRIERTFNRFHLISEEKTTQGNNVQQVFTTYYADVDLDQPFANQPPQCQLPRSVETRWSLKNGAVPARSQSVSSRYDTHGNLTEQIQANGIKEAYEYFPVAGIPGECPADPQGFVRNLRQKTVTPATGRESGAPVLCTRNVFALIKPLAGASDDSLALTDETLYEVNGTQETELQHTAYKTSDTPTNPLLHGRRVQQAVTLNGLTTTTDYAYEKLNSLFVGETVLQTTETLKGYDHGVGGAFTLKKVILEHSLLHGEQLLARDDNDVEIRTTYDALLRVAGETVAPNTDYVATRRYRYFLAGSGDGQASQEVTDVKGVITRTLFDGLNRPIAEQRQDKDHQSGAKAEAFRDTYKARYDALGQLEEEIEYDWRTANPADDLVLVSRYRYDDWSAQSSMIRADGVEEHEVTDPIKQTVTAWIDGLGKTVTHVNLFDKPERIQRYQLNDDPTDPQTKPYSEHTYHYDGLGRTAHEFDALRHKTAYVYDTQDRVLRTTLPDNAQVERRYAPHSSEDLPVWIGVHANGNVKELGEQTFDGLGRMTRSITGGRVTCYQFKQGELTPCKVIRPSKMEVDYHYEPALGEEPLSRTTSSMAATYDYDEKTARLRSSKESGITLWREYHTTGEIKSETRSQAGETFTMFYDYSRQSRLLKYVDVLGQEQDYDYEKSTGRLLSTTLGTTRSTFKYNTQGEIERIETTDGAQNLTIRLTNDCYGREVLREFDVGGGVTQQLSQAYDLVDRLIRSTLTEGATLLRDQTYGYDARGHLETYECTGTQPPVDPYGKTIESQLFIVDELDNIKRMDTYFSTGHNRGIYHYDNPADPAQLTSVTNDHADYPSEIRLSYNADGNLDNDEEGRKLEYDELGRLIRVSVEPGGASRAYRYDSQDKLVGDNDGTDEQHRFYQGAEIHNLKQGANSSTFIHGAGNVLAELQAGAGPKSLLLASDEMNSVLREVEGGVANDIFYSAYGHRSAERPPSTGLGYNGEFRELETGLYLLGNGYRAFNPVLLKFHSSDSWGPFSKAGLNTYTYCLGNPVLNKDPSGHITWGGVKRYFGIFTKSNKQAKKQAFDAWRRFGMKAGQGETPLQIAGLEPDKARRLSAMRRSSPEQQLAAEHATIALDLDGRYSKNMSWLFDVGQGQIFAKPNKVEKVAKQNQRLLNASETNHLEYEAGMQKLRLSKKPMESTSQLAEGAAASRVRFASTVPRSTQREVFERSADVRGTRRNRAD